MIGNATENATGSSVSLTAITASPSSRVSDIYSFKPGQADSLRRATSVIP
jgi:hypothetical protein